MIHDSDETLYSSLTATRACVEWLHRTLSVTKIPKPALLSTPSNGIQLEWHRSGWDIEIEFHVDGRIEFWGENRDGDQISGDHHDIEDMVAVLSRMPD